MGAATMDQVEEARRAGLAAASALRRRMGWPRNIELAAEDLASVGWAGAWRKIERTPGPLPGQVLRRAARDAIIDYIRAVGPLKRYTGTRRYPTVQLSQLESSDLRRALDLVGRADGGQHRVDLADLADAILRSMPAATREIFLIVRELLSRGEGSARCPGLEEAARRLGLRPVTVHARVRAWRERCRLAGDVTDPELWGMPE